MENQRLLSMDEQYYRTFIAIPVQPGERFHERRKELMHALAGERISWVGPDRYHVTLRFIGETRVSAIGEIAQSLKKEVKIPVKMHLEFAELGSFGPRKNPRVVWLGFKQTILFDPLRKGVDAALEKCGFPIPDQPFRAHLTLGRIRSLDNRERFYGIVEEMKDLFSEQVILDRLIFYRSELGSGGPVYTPLAQWEFYSTKQD